MRRALVFAAVLLLVTSCASSPQAMEANRAMWNHDGVVTVPPPDAGYPCGTIWVRTAKPEGSWWRRVVWHVNGHFSERPSPGVCR